MLSKPGAEISMLYLYVNDKNYKWFDDTDMKPEKEFYHKCLKLFDTWLSQFPYKEFTQAGDL